VRILEALGSQLLALLIVISIFLLPWWLAALLAVALLVGFITTLDLVFPLVAAEPLGSKAYNRRAAIYFLLAAPVLLVLIVAMYVAMFRG